MKHVQMEYEIIDTKVVAKVEGGEVLLKDNQILDYLRLLDLKDYYKTLTDPDDICQIDDMIRRIEKRLSIQFLLRFNLAIIRLAKSKIRAHLASFLRIEIRLFISQ